MTAERILQQARHVVIELDGGLADTSEIAPGDQRRPFDILGCEDPLVEAMAPSRWAHGELPLLPGRLRASGRTVTILCDSDLPYASTLLGLLGVDAVPVRFGSDQAAWDGATLHPDTVYIGPRDHPRWEAAESVGMQVLEAAALQDQLAPVGDAEQEGRLPDGLADDDVSEIVRHLCRGGGRHRRALQTALSQAVESSHRYCLVTRGGASADGWQAGRIVGGLFTREEADANPAIYNTFLRRLFPLQKMTLDGFVHRWVVPFSSRGVEFDPLGRVMVDIKDYHRPRGSGPAPQLQSLRLVADVLAAHLRAEGTARVEPIPSHPFSPERPGRVSMWLAGWIAARAMAEIVRPIPPDVWTARGPTLNLQSFPPSSQDGHWLVDDQCTTGNSLRRHAAFRSSPVAGLVTWSTSQSRDPRAPPSRGNGCRWPESGRCPIHDRPTQPTPADLPIVRDSPPTSPQGASTLAPQAGAPSVDVEDTRLAETVRFEALKRWRWAEASSQGRPAFTVAHDKTLHEVAQRDPSSASQLLGIHGFGRFRVESYGEAILDLLQHLRRGGDPDDWVGFQ